MTKKATGSGQWLPPWVEPDLEQKERKRVLLTCYGSHRCTAGLSLPRLHFTATNALHFAWLLLQRPAPKVS